MDRFTVFYDLEVGGLDHTKHPIVEIAAAAVSDEFKVIDEFSTRLIFNPDKCTPKSLELIRYEERDWSDAVLPGQAVRSFSDFLRRFSCVPTAKKKKPEEDWYATRLAGHNIARFDDNYLRTLFDRYDEFCVGSYWMLDTYALACWWSWLNSGNFAGGRSLPLGLGSLHEHFFGTEIEGAHSALADVRANIQVAKALLECMQTSLSSSPFWALGQENA